MSVVSLVTLVAALAFVSFHLPIPALSTGRTARLIGISYHLLMLPAVAALPAPDWAKAAGFAWMLADVVLDGAAFVGLPNGTGDSLRQGVHVLSAVWVLAAGWTGGVGLAVVGTLLGIVFLARFVLSSRATPPSKWLTQINAILNGAWTVAVAIALWC